MKHLLNSLLVLTFVSSGSTFKAKLPMRDVAQSHALSKSSLMMFDVLSVAAGSIAGAVGVGFAYPLDSMKTKIQNRAASSGSSDKQNLSFLSIAKDILRNEGVLSLYKGVIGVMLGNALIKACAFTANRWALAEITTGSPTLDQLIVAAAFSGMVTSFFSNPIERVKVLMQSKVQTNFDCDAAGSETKEEDSELQIISHVLKSEGLQGLAFRGLDATLAREIPGYSLYFVGYFTMIHTPLGEGLGPGGPVVMGALAGMFSWLIVFPLDVCKT